MMMGCTSLEQGVTSILIENTLLSILAVTKGFTFKKKREEFRMEILARRGVGIGTRWEGLEGIIMMTAESEGLELEEELNTRKEIEEEAGLGQGIDPREIINLQEKNRDIMRAPGMIEFPEERKSEDRGLGKSEDQDHGLNLSWTRKDLVTTIMLEWRIVQDLQEFLG